WSPEVTKISKVRVVLNAAGWRRRWMQTAGDGVARPRCFRRDVPMKARACVLIGVFLLGGCHYAPPACDKGAVHEELAAREGPLIPPDELLASLPEDAAVALALWNNALFNEQLADLGVAKGGRIQAGSLPLRL